MSKENNYAINKEKQKWLCIEIRVLFWEDFKVIFKEHPDIIAEYNSIGSSSRKATPVQSKKICNEDIELFRAICNLFTPSVRYWLTEMDIGGAHPYSVFIGLSNYVDRPDDPFSEFMDPELEKLRGDLLSSINSFLSYKAVNTFPEDINGELYSVTHKWILEHGDGTSINMSSEECLVQFAQEAQNLNKLATDVWNVYCDFVRQGRHRLAQSQFDA